MKERFELLEKAIIAMVEDKKYATLRDILVTVNPADIAGIFNYLDDKRIPLEKIMSDTYAIENFQQAMDQAVAAKGLKHVITF